MRKIFSNIAFGIIAIAIIFLVGCSVQNNLKKCGDGVCSIQESKIGKCPVDCKSNSEGNINNGKQAETKNITEPTHKEEPIKVLQNKPSAFDFGVEYGPLGLAKTYAKTGAHVIKPYPESVMWKNIQSSASSNYNWANLDGIVKEYQDAGFDKMHLLITAESKWASRDAAGLKVKDTRPKPEYEDDYARFVKAAVERYDMDGKDDMDGLKYAINEWGVERELSGFWPGTGAEYVELLKLAYPAIKEANPDAKVMLNALFMSSMFNGNPGDEEVERRIREEKITGNAKTTMQDISIILDAVNYYDVVDIHLLGDYSEIPAAMKWLRKELKKRGVEKEVYGGDVFPMSPLFIGLETCNTGPLAGKEIYPVDSKSRCEAVKLIGSLRNKNDLNYKKAHEWIERNIAINIPRKFAVSSYEGLSGINIGNMEDWFIPFGAGTSPYMGLVDTASMLDVVRKPKEERPGLYALEMSIKYLDGFESVKKIEAGENVYAYEFTNSGKKVIIAWYDDGGFYGIDSKISGVSVSMPWGKSAAKVIEVPIKRGDEEGSMDIINAKNGKLDFNLGYTTVFIIEA